MKEQALAYLFYKEIVKIRKRSEWTEVQKLDALYRLLAKIFLELTQKERFQFATLFARMAYACHRQEIPKDIQHYIHAFRREAVKALQTKYVEQWLIELGTKAVAETIRAFYGQQPNEAARHWIQPSWPYDYIQPKIKAFKPKARVLALADDQAKGQLLVRDEAFPEEEIRVQYNLSERNDIFNASIRLLRSVFRGGVMLNLIDVEVDEDNVYRPGALVIEPDFLMDVSAVAECFKDFGAESRLFLLKKYLPFQTTKYLMLGNIANFFLDELMTNKEATFKELFPKVFRLNPLAFCLFDDREVREIMELSQKHYYNLKRMVLHTFPENKIDADACFLEPTFYSEKYGLQGRLDIFCQNGKQSAIVELKSGKAFKPNIYGLSNNHFIQTLLYDLMVKSVFGNRLNVANYILYSGEAEKHLRFAPTVKAKQYEAIQIRNQLVGIERQLSQLGESQEAGLIADGERIFGKIRMMHFPYAKGFIERDVLRFERVYAQMTALEKKYFISFSGFIAREHQLAKIGVEGQENINGLASLWLNPQEEKHDNYELLKHLQLEINRAGEEEPFLLFRRTAATHPLANFRKGDIAVLYPDTKTENAVLRNQIFKCTIVEIDAERVILRLRSRQFNDLVFKENVYWNVEHDLLDGSFNSMYRGLFEFAASPISKRALLLGNKAPSVPEDIEVGTPAELTGEQKEILQKAIKARDYFLLWGPPGTGKTSMMLKHLVGHLMQHTEENILLLAYTNRAVDEICEAIERLGNTIKEDYIRIGSRYSTSPQFHEQLLNEKIRGIKKRRDLKQVIAQRRIFVSTVASMANKHELFQLKKFHRVIIDEASQVLEPMLVGLLPKFERFILIGDHKQLPAVVVQDVESSNIEDKDLQGIGLNNMRNSLFERLFKLCKQHKWDWAYAQLSHQGRMHQDIMAFPNQYFYENTLHILPASLKFHEKQVQALPNVDGIVSPLFDQLSARRISFFATPCDQTSITLKTNQFEADRIGDLVEYYLQYFRQQGKEITKNSIGIITPYRAQIAQIKSTLEAKKAPLDLLTIDTVERYQGGAREVILISLCTNVEHQLRSLVSVSEEGGVDRKLNVALTRAREHVVILGNPDILKLDPIYRALMAFCGMNKL